MTKPEQTQSATDLAELLGLNTPQLPAVVDNEVEDTEEQYEKRKRGRPKGSVSVRKQATKSSVTQQRLALEAGIRDYISGSGRLEILRDAIDRTLRIAAYGFEDKDAVSAMRVLLDRLMATAKQEEEATGHAPPAVTIVIENATVKPAPKVVDAEYTEIPQGK